MMYCGYVSRGTETAVCMLKWIQVTYFGNTLPKLEQVTELKMEKMPWKKGRKMVFLELFLSLDSE